MLADYATQTFQVQIYKKRKNKGREGEEKKADDSHNPEAKQTGYN